MYFRHIYEDGLAQASYMIGCQASGEAIVIDPRRDIDVYLDVAEKEGLRIRYVTETHIHADFLSGARELAAATGAELLLSDEGGRDWRYQFPHRGLRGGEVIELGNLQLTILHTPGHTPEHISFLLTDTPASPHPLMLFTGDYVFVGDVGRPDLLEEAAHMQGTKEPAARTMFRSLRLFRELPDFVQVWPGHGAGSACGKSLGAVPSSTVGYEKLSNWALQIEDEDRFVSELLSGQPEPPPYFARMKKLNKEGPRILGSLPHPTRLALTRFHQLWQDGVLIVDTRDKLAFAGGHVPGSLNIQDTRSFSTWAGWMLSEDQPFVLIADERRIADLSRALIRIGLDDVAGYLPNLRQWTQMGNPLRVLAQITAPELYARLRSNEVQVIDVRTHSEYVESHIPGAIHIHAGHLVHHLDEIPRHKSVVINCLGGDRSSVAASYLQAQGFTQVINLTGGIRSWWAERYPVETGDEASPALA